MHARVTLLCLPCAGASATMYMRWRRSLPPWIALLPVELPGRGARLGEALVDDFDGLVAQLCREHDAAMRGRFAFFGHSMGALLAHGLARRLQAAGRDMPRALIVAGSPAPSVREAPLAAGQEAAGDDLLIEELRRQGGTPDELFEHPEMLRMTLDVMAADYRVCASHVHRPRPRMAVPVHAFCGRDDSFGADRVEPWADETAGAFTVDWFEGGHFFVRQREAEVLGVLQQRLHDAIAASEGTAEGADAARATV